MFKFYKIPVPPEDSHSGEIPAEANRLQKYIQAQTSQNLSRLTSEISAEVKQLVAVNVQALMGYLPSSEFNTTIMTTKESMQNLLASAMLTGYFVHAMENRMKIEDLFGADQDSRQEPAAEPALQAPETLFKHVSPDPAEPKGQFLTLSELQKQLQDNTHSLDSALEINSPLAWEALIEEVQSLDPTEDEGL